MNEFAKLLSAFVKRKGVKYSPLPGIVVMTGRICTKFSKVREIREERL